MQTREMLDEQQKAHCESNYIKELLKVLKIVHKQLGSSDCDRTLCRQIINEVIK